MRISISPILRKQDYGHQAVAVMLSCNGIVLNYAIVLYDKSRSKVKIVQEIANELPVPPVISYFLCDSWYTCGDIMDAFIKKGFYTIGALKTNRILYPCGIKQKISEFSLHIRKTDSDVSLVIKISDEEFEKIDIEKSGICGAWNYCIKGFKW